jgi:hypothetical protein
MSSPSSPYETPQLEAEHSSLAVYKPVLRLLWKARRLVLMIAAITGVAAAVALWMLGRFESEGLYQLIAPSINAPSVRTAEASTSLSVGMPTFSEFKVVSALLAEPERMRAYLSEKGLSEDAELSDLPRALRDPVKQRQWLAPVYAFTKADSKEFVDNPTAKEYAGQVVGVRVAATARSADVAQRRNKVLAEYIRDVVFLQTLTDYIRTRSSESKRAALTYENSVISNRNQLKVATDRLRELKTVALRNPDAARGDSRSVLSLTDSTTRFLPLPTQVMAADVNAVELNLAFESARRLWAQTEYTSTYFEALQKSMVETKTADALIKRMSDAKAAADKGRDLNDEKIKQVSNATLLEIQTLEDAFNNRSRFIAGPTLPERSLKMPAITLLLGFLAGLVGASCWIIIRQWFLTNKAEIFS